MSEKKQKRSFREDVFPANDPIENDNAVLTKVSESSLPISQFSFAQCRKPFKKKIFPATKHIFLKDPFGHAECSVDNLAELFREKTHIFTLSDRKREENENSFSIDIPAKKDPIDTENAIMAILQKVIARKPYFFIFSQKVFKKKISIDKTYFFLERCLWTRRTQFWQPRRTFKTKDPYFSALGPKTGNNKNSFTIDFSPEYDPIDTENAVLTTLSKCFCDEAKVFYILPKSVQ